MVQRPDDHNSPAEEDSALDPLNDDERVGEAIEAYLALAEQGPAPEIEEFAARYPRFERRRARGPRGARARAWLAGARIGWFGVGPWIRLRSAHRIGAADRRLSRGPRAGAWWYGNGLRGGARGAGTARWRSRCWASTPRLTHRPDGGS